MGPLTYVLTVENPRLLQYSYGVVLGEPDVAEITFQFPPMDKEHPVVLALLAKSQS